MDNQKLKNAKSKKEHCIICSDVKDISVIDSEIFMK